MTFDDLWKLEPRLLALYRKVQSIREQDDGRSPFSANRCWQNAKSTGLRDELRLLVGWDAATLPHSSSVSLRLPPVMSTTRCRTAATARVHRSLI